MKTRLANIMLVDDDADDNFFHEREIKKIDPETTIIVKNSAFEALSYLKSMEESSVPPPDLIFLDINMPRMNGWEFLLEYNQLDKALNRASIIMLTTSENPNDKARAKTWTFVIDFISKPLTMGIMKDLVARYFSQTIPRPPVG